MDASVSPKVSYLQLVTIARVHHHTYENVRVARDNSSYLQAVYLKVPRGPGLISLLVVLCWQVFVKPC